MSLMRTILTAHEFYILNQYAWILKLLAKQAFEIE